VLQGISNTFTMNNTSHITQMLKDKIERLESSGEKSYFIGSQGTAELKLTRGPTRRQSKQTTKVEIANYYYQWKNKGKEELHSFCQNTKRDRGERYFERYYRNGLAPWFREIKMNRPAFISINRMRAGHTSSKQASKDLTLYPRPNANVATGCKRRNISSEIVNGTRSSGQQ
jgi:hypothetical protein